MSLNEWSAAKMEETKLLNGNRAALLFHAPIKWRELKQAFRTQCANMPTGDLQCDEQNDNALFVSRVRGGVSIRLLKVTFHPDAPGVTCEGITRYYQATITFMVEGQTALYVVNGVARPYVEIDDMLIALMS